MPNKSDITLSLVGQSLIEFQPSAEATANMLELKSFISADAAFTNLEVTVPGQRGGWPMKDLAWCTRPETGSIGILQEMGFNLLSLSNNHSWDLGPTGILDTIDAVEREGILCHAGTGSTLEESEAPTILNTPNGRIGLLAMASGNIAPEAFATSTEVCGDRARPGVNPIRVQDIHEIPAQVFEELSQCAIEMGYLVDADGLMSIDGTNFMTGSSPTISRRVDPIDEGRHLDNIRRLRADVDVLIVYVHQHHWEKEWQKVGPWLQNFARQCIDAGADLFVGHGVPMLQAIEVYNSKLISYSLGNFIFHPTAGGRTWPDRRCWRSVVVRLRKSSEGSWIYSFHPIVLGASRAIEEDQWDDPSRRFPRLATPQEAESVLDEIDELSAPFGVKLERRLGVGTLRLNGSC